jgi:hypothetical protein
MVRARLEPDWWTVTPRRGGTRAVSNPLLEGNRPGNRVLT